AARHAPHVHLPVDRLDADADVAELAVDPLGDRVELVHLEPAAVAIAGVGELPRGLVTGPAGVDRESLAQVADRGLAALPVLAQRAAAALRRGTPAQVARLYLARTHALAAHGRDLDEGGPDDHVDVQRPGRAGVDRVVDQLQDGVGRRPVVGEE